ncbi:hypothetical protein GCM10009411_39260 [Shewanella litoralis]|uniref:H repeat-associated protein N-terminal domain-containing protein n=1 Tax=Shewanella litoralis TaxID=2282700 RepID=A0ABQ2RKS6_9GAMM|nr:hypothetical protein GCM10009411_39260 [Shewanella litoralis]
MPRLEEIEDFGHDRLDWLRKFVSFENGIPKHDTIARVIGTIDMITFQSYFSKWMQECHQVTAGQVIAIDGKRLKVHLINLVERMPFIW